MYCDLEGCLKYLLCANLEDVEDLYVELSY